MPVHSSVGRLADGQPTLRPRVCPGGRGDSEGSDKARSGLGDGLGPVESDPPPRRSACH